MTGVAVLLIGVAAALLLAAVAWRRWSRQGPGRHERRDQAAEAEADDFITAFSELPALRAPIPDMYSHPTVRLLPWTPAVQRCSDPPEESCADAGCPVHGWDGPDDPFPGDEDWEDDGFPDHDALCECRECRELDRYREALRERLATGTDVRRAAPALTGVVVPAPAAFGEHWHTPGDCWCQPWQPGTGPGARYPLAEAVLLGAGLGPGYVTEILGGTVDELVASIARRAVTT